MQIQELYKLISQGEQLRSVEFKKSMSWKTKNMLQEKIEAKMFFYEKKKDGIKIEYDF